MYRTAPQVPDPADLQQCLATLPHSSALLALAAPSSFSLRQFTGWDPPPALPTPLVGPSVGFQHSHLSLSLSVFRPPSTPRAPQSSPISSFTSFIIFSGGMFCGYGPTLLKLKYSQPCHLFQTGAGRSGGTQPAQLCS